MLLGAIHFDRHVVRTCSLLSLLLTLAAPSAVLADCPPLLPGQNEFLRGQVQIRVTGEATIASVQARIEDSFPGTTILRSIDEVATYLLQVPTEQLDCDLLEVLIESMVRHPGTLGDPNRPLAWAELNYETETTEGSTGTVFVSSVFPTALPMYNAQYATATLGVTAAQGLSTGRRTAVAVLDTGIDPDHPLLSDVLLDGYNFVNDSTDTSEQRDGVDDDGDGRADEMFGHGTFMAGLIHHVAPDARILPVVVLNNDGQGDAFVVAQGIHYAISRGVEVINLSAGSTHESEVVEDALAAARQRGIVVVAAAGNDGRREPPRFPATSGAALGVAATDSHDQRASFSNYHSDLLLAAPGDSQATGFLAPAVHGRPARQSVSGYDPQRSIFSTLPDGQLGIWEGTSVATAFVSGGCALICAQHPDWPRTSETAEALEELLLDTAKDIDAMNPGFENELGEGRLDIAAATARGPAQPPLSDVDNDGQVSLNDLATLLADFGLADSMADLNADGTVNLTDLALLLRAYGA